MPNILGSKWENIKTKNNYSLSELYEKIKGANFPCGAPNLTHHITKDIIFFPPIGKRNQIWMDGDNGKFKIYNSTTMATIGEMADVAFENAIWSEVDMADMELSKKYKTTSNRWITYKMIDEIKEIIDNMSL